MKDKFYLDYDEIDCEYVIMESDTDIDDKKISDIGHFCIKKLFDADNAVKLLNKLYRQAHDR